MVNPNHITPYSEIGDEERELTDDLVFNRREDALERFISHFESKGEEAEAEVADPTAGMEPEEALHWHVLRRKKDGVEEWIDKSVEKIGAVPTLNEVLLPAMKEVGDKFGAGELILPFVLQSAEVMKRAVAQLENYLDRIEGHTKGKVVIATVFGDVHDIGKSLVNTILTNNGYTVIDLGKQVPVDAIIEAAVENEADAIGLSALLVSTSKQMPTCIAELHERGLGFPVLIGGAAINRDFGRRMLYPKGRESDEVYEPGVFYCKDAFQGLDTMDALVDDDARAALVERIRGRGQDAAREAGQGRHGPPVTDASVRSKVSDRQPAADARPTSAPARSRSTSTTSTPSSTATSSSSSTGAAKARKGEEWRRLVEGYGDDEGFVPRLERMWREQDYLRPKAKLGYFPCNSEGNELIVFDPEDHDRELERLVFPRQPKHDRICLADFYRPLSSRRTRRRRPPGRDRRRRGDRTDGPPRRGRRGDRAVLGPRPRRAVGRGAGRVAALRRPPPARDRARPGPPLLMGLPGLPGPVRAREGLAPARPRRHRHDPLRRLRGDARAVDGRDRRPPPAGRLLRHEVRLHPRGARWPTN